MARVRDQGVVPHVPSDAKPADYALSLGTLDLGGAIREYRLSRATLYKLMASGVVAYTRSGRKRLIARRSLIDYLAANLVCG
jgi:excisionase family DNA binding protein